VPDHLFGQAAVALSMALTVPRGRSRRTADPYEPLVETRRSSPQARSGARRRHETRRRVVTAATGRFDRGWERVSMSEVAEWAGVATQTVVNLFGSVRAVAAVTFGRFVEDVRSVVRETPDLPPLEGLAHTLEQLSRSAATDPEASRALLEERTATRLQRGDRLGATDIRLEVPLADSVMYWLVAMRLHGAEPTDVASTLIDFVISQSLSRPGREAEIVELAMRLLPRPPAALT
jgi:AcrR family transcriptional regulator